MHHLRPAAVTDRWIRAQLSDRGLTVNYRTYGGAGVKEAAERALLGTDEDIRQFLQGHGDLELADDHVDASRILNAGGPAVREAAKTALAGTSEELHAFLKGGWKAPHQQDRRVEVSRIINLGGAGGKDAGQAALNGTPQDVEKFLESGQYTARNADERVTASQLVNTGGPEVKSAATVALVGSADILHDLVEVGQYMAERKDKPADTHIAQVQRLIAEGSIVAAKAQQNRWLAAKAAAEANQAAAEADQAAADLMYSAEPLSWRPDSRRVPPTCDDLDCRDQNRRREEAPNG